MACRRALLSSCSFPGLGSPAASAQQHWRAGETRHTRAREAGPEYSMITNQANVYVRAGSHTHTHTHMQGPLDFDGLR